MTELAVWENRQLVLQVKTVGLTMLDLGLVVLPEKICHTHPEFMGGGAYQILIYLIVKK